MGNRPIKPSLDSENAAGARAPAGPNGRTTGAARRGKADGRADGELAHAVRRKLLADRLFRQAIRTIAQADEPAIECAAPLAPLASPSAALGGAGGEKRVPHGAQIVPAAPCAQFGVAQAGARGQADEAAPPLLCVSAGPAVLLRRNRRRGLAARRAVWQSRPAPSSAASAAHPFSAVEGGAVPDPDGARESVALDGALNDAPPPNGSNLERGGGAQTLPADESDSAARSSACAPRAPLPPCGTHARRARVERTFGLRFDFCNAAGAGLGTATGKGLRC